MDPEFVRPKRWEGKPLSFKWRYLWANYPEIGLASFAIGLICPFLAMYRIYSYDTGINRAYKKYKNQYRVVRHDDPRIPEIMEQKEFGRHFFPK